MSRRGDRVHFDSTVVLRQLNFRVSDTNDMRLAICQWLMLFELYFLSSNMSETPFYADVVLNVGAEVHRATRSCYI